MFRSFGLFVGVFFSLSFGLYGATAALAVEDRSPAETPLRPLPLSFSFVSPPRPISAAPAGSGAGGKALPIVMEGVSAPFGILSPPGNRSITEEGASAFSTDDGPVYGCLDVEAEARGSAGAITDTAKRAAVVWTAGVQRALAVGRRSAGSGIRRSGDSLLIGFVPEDPLESALFSPVAEETIGLAIGRRLVLAPKRASVDVRRSIVGKRLLPLRRKNLYKTPAAWLVYLRRGYRQNPDFFYVGLNVLRTDRKALSFFGREAAIAFMGGLKMLCLEKEAPGADRILDARPLLEDRE